MDSIDWLEFPNFVSNTSSEPPYFAITCRHPLRNPRIRIFGFYDHISGF